MKNELKRTQADFYDTVVTNCTLKSVIACSRVAAAAINVIASACFAKNCMDSSNHDGRSNIIGRLHWRHTRFRAVREFDPGDGGSLVALCTAPLAQPKCFDSYRVGCPLSGVKRTAFEGQNLSAFDPKRTSASISCCGSEADFNPY